ncbi:MAG: DNA-binding domain-containing protein [Candidatus Thiodiazotropha sp.]
MRLLAELQRDFCDALLSSEEPPAALLSEIADDHLALQRFQVYRNNFIVLNGDAVADMYPVIKRLLGDEAFRMLATAYVRNDPPSERTLLLYGEHFADFLSAIPELSALPYLSDIARLEFAWTAAYHAADEVPLRAEQIAHLSSDVITGFQLQPHSSMQLLASDYPIQRIWMVHQDSTHDEVISLDEGGCRLAVIRPQSTVEVRELSKGEFELLSRLADAANVAQAFESAIEVEPEFDLQQFFAQHLLDGTFTNEIKIPDVSEIT